MGTGALGWLLAYFGFVANVDQAAGSGLGIRLLFSVIPAALALAGTLAIFFYPITDLKMKEIEADLARRKGVPE